MPPAVRSVSAFFVEMVAERGERILQEFSPALPGLRSALHLENRGSGRLDVCAPSLQETPVKVEGEGHRYQDQHDIPAM